MTQTLDDLRLLRPREAADVLGVSVRQIDRMVDAGTLRPVRLLPNGNRRFRVADLAALVNETTDDFDEVGKDFVDKATGKSYRIVLSDPTVSDDPKDSGIELFFVTWDQRLAYLKPTGSEGRSTSTFIGNLGGGLAS